jgi:UDP-N-acetyl-D-mannosaminuronic acid transferase (WecB/TagA/CpsF family)
MGDDAGAAAAATATAASTHPGTQRTDVFGVPCFRGTLAEAAAVVVQLAREGRGGYACLCNVHVLETAHRDPRLSKALDEARVVFPDGAPIAWVQRFLARAPAHRVGGPDLMTHVLREGCAVGLEHAFYGSTEEVLAPRPRSSRTWRLCEPLVRTSSGSGSELPGRSSGPPGMPRLSRPLS